MPQIVRIEGLGHTYSGGKRALSSVNLQIAEGERVALIGPSGSGKSTLLRTINGLLPPTEGTVTVLGHRVTQMPEAGQRDLRRRIGMVFQEFALIERLTVLTNVLVGRLGYTPAWRSVARTFPEADIQLARTLIANVGLGGMEERLVNQLSGGQKQRVGIARALAQEPKLILGDEPTANLDVRTADEILNLLVRLATERGVTLLLSLHDVRAATRHCSRLIALKDGRIAWDGAATEFDDEQIEAVFYS